jgi:hypothetical protein
MEGFLASMGPLSGRRNQLDEREPGCQMTTFARTDQPTFKAPKAAKQTFLCSTST